jgi:tetratricopeptide (TPR) repeat protein
MTGRVGVFAVLVLALGAEAFAGNAQWVQVKSPNFTVITDAGEKKGRDTALHFEQMRAVFGTIFNKAKVASSQPLYILAFKSSKEFKALCPLWKGKPEELAGYFQPGNGVTYIALDLAQENRWNVIFHEYGHFLLNSNSIESPPWFDEGFAEYYSTVKVDGKHFVFGNIPQGDPEILQQYQWLPVDQLFSVAHDSPFYNEHNRQTIFYAESWLAMSHYFFNNKNQKQVWTLLQLQHRGVSVDDAIQQVFGMDAKALDKDLHNFYSSGKVGVFQGDMPAGMDGLTMTAGPVEEIDARARVAELKLQMKDHRAEGVQEFEQIVKEKPDHPVALRGLAYAALQNGEKEKAADYFKRAAATQSDDAHIYFFSAVLAMQLDAQHNPELLNQMQSSLQKALQLDPSFADAYGWLGLTYAWQGKMQEAVEPTEKAVELSPRNEQWSMNLAGYYANAERYDEALKICQTLAKSSNGMVAQQAASMYSSLNQYKEEKAKYNNWKKEQEEKQKQEEVEVAAAEKASLKEREAPKDKNATGPAPGHTVRASGRMSEDSVLNFFEGTLKQVVCAPQQTTFVVVSRSQVTTLVTSDVQQVSFSGNGTFSCDLANVKVKGFYSQKLNAKRVVALEFQ